MQWSSLNSGYYVFRHSYYYKVVICCCEILYYSDELALLLFGNNDHNLKQIYDLLHAIEAHKRAIANIV